MKDEVKVNEYHPVRGGRVKICCVLLPVKLKKFLVIEGTNEEQVVSIFVVVCNLQFGINISIKWNCNITWRMLSNLVKCS